MTELFIKNKFIQFLKSDKNFPDDSFLLNYHYVDKGGIIYVDLAILDTKTNNYIALIDFRNNISNDDIENYNLYKKVLSQKDATFYVVTPNETNDDFSIYTLFNSELINVSKDEFPNFQTLISKRKADEKADLESIIEEEKKENINKKNVLTTTLATAIVSLIIAMLLTQSLDIFNFDNTKTKKENDIVNSNIYKELEKLKLQLSIIDSKKDTITKTDIEIEQIKKRLINIEKLITQDPKNILELQKIDNHFERLNQIIDREKELNNLKVEKLEDKMNTYSNIIFSLLVTIIGAILGYLFSNFKPKKISANNS